MCEYYRSLKREGKSEDIYIVCEGKIEGKTGQSRRGKDGKKEAKRSAAASWCGIVFFFFFFFFLLVLVLTGCRSLSAKFAGINYGVVNCPILGKPTLLSPPLETPTEKKKKKRNNDGNFFNFSNNFFRVNITAFFWKYDEWMIWYKSGAN